MFFTSEKKIFLFLVIMLSKSQVQVWDLYLTPWLPLEKKIFSNLKCSSPVKKNFLVLVIILSRIQVQVRDLYLSP